MTEENEVVEEVEVEKEVQEPSELDLLKARAKTIGFKYHHKVGAKKLAKQIEEFLNKKDAEKVVEAPKEENDIVSPGRPKVVRNASKGKISIRIPEGHIDLSPDDPVVPKILKTVSTPMQRKAAAIKNAKRLIRIQVTNMNPNKKDYEGEIYTVSNAVVGTFKKYVPFNVPWHVENIIYKNLINRKCQVFYNTRDGRGNSVRKSKEIPELNVVVLPPLTPAEMEELRIHQARANNLDD